MDYVQFVNMAIYCYKNNYMNFSVNKLWANMRNGRILGKTYGDMFIDLDFRQGDIDRREKEPI